MYYVIRYDVNADRIYRYETRLNLFNLIKKLGIDEEPKLEDFDIALEQQGTGGVILQAKEASRAYREFVDLWIHAPTNSFWSIAKSVEASFDRFYSGFVYFVYPGLYRSIFRSPERKRIVKFIGHGEDPDWYFPYSFWHLDGLWSEPFFDEYTIYLNVKLAEFKMNQIDIYRMLYRDIFNVPEEDITFLGKGLSSPYRYCATIGNQSLVYVSVGKDWTGAYEDLCELLFRMFAGYLSRDYPSPERVLE